MNVHEIRERVAEIDKLDSESAHAAEDELHRKVLQAIADGSAKNMRGCAAAALTTLEVDFDRWYA